MKLLKPNTVLTLMSATNFDADISYDSDHTVIRHLGEIYSQMIKENLWPKLKVFQCNQHLKDNLRSNMSEDEIRSQLMSQKEKEPLLMDGINIDEESKKIKQRFYRD